MILSHIHPLVQAVYVIVLVAITASRRRCSFIKHIGIYNCIPVTFSIKKKSTFAHQINFTKDNLNYCLLVYMYDL